MTNVCRNMLHDTFHTVTNNATIYFVQVLLHLVDRKDQDLEQGMYLFGITGVQFCQNQNQYEFYNSM